MRRLIFILCAMIGVSQAQTIQYIGAPTTTVISRGNFRTDSIFYLPKRSKAPTDTAALRYQISDSSLYVWSGSQWIKAGGSGTIFGSGITGYLPQFSASTTLDTSALFTLGNRLGVGTSSFAYNTTSTGNVELNGTAGGILGFKRNDSARGYLWHTGDNMELANTVAGSISFNTNSATRGSIASDGVWRLHNLAGTGDRVVVASSNGTLSAASSATGLVDTTTISTRAWRQKGDDSLGAIIATKGSGTVTSVATGYGLSGGTITTTGTFLVDTLNIATRAWRQKGLDSLAALEVSGSGTTNYVPKFTASSTIGNSQIFDNGTNVGIGNSSPSASAKLDVTGAIRASTDLYLGIASSSTGRGYFFNSANTNRGEIYFDNSNNNFRIESTYGGGGTSQPMTFWTGFAERLRIFTNGRVFIGASPTDAGYQLDINGTLRSVNGANFATTSGNVGVGTASPAVKLDVTASGGDIAAFRRTDAGNALVQYTNANTTDDIIHRFRLNAGSGNFYDLRYYATGGYFGLQYNGNDGLHLTTSSEVLINTTTDAGDYKLQVSGNIYNTGSITTGAPSGGSIKPWKIGEAATVSPTSPNRTIRVEIDGTVYYLHAKTTND